MHYLIRLIVEAANAEEAKLRADTILTDLVERHEIDWYHNGEEGSRWADCWKPMRLTTKKGKAVATEALSNQHQEFLWAMNAIRLMLERYTDEQILNEDFNQTTGHYFSRYHFTVAGGCGANACYLFSLEGKQLSKQRELDRYLDDTEKYWIVQVDCHN